MKPTGTPPASPFLWGFIVLFISLGLGYSALTPIFENSDETLHYPYIKHLADGQGLPLAAPGQLWNQEGTQHPLYYAIVAASTFWIDSDNLLDHLQRNPHWLFTEVRAVINDNQNLVLHGPLDAFPYRRAALAIHIGRWWSLVFGLLTVICAFLIAQHLFPHNLPLSLTATALTALNPQFIRVSTTVSNDSLSAALTTLAALVALKVTAPSFLAQRTDPAPHLRMLHSSILRMLRSFRLRMLYSSILRMLRSSMLRMFRPSAPLLPRPPAPLHPSSFTLHPYKAPLLLGLLCGLALLTKLSSLSTFLIVAFILFWRLFFLSELHQTPWLTLLRWLAIIGAITLALNGWWFWRNYQLYGEWLATETHLNLAGRGDLSLVEVWELRAEVERAYWATFGWGQIRPPEWVYQALFWLTRLGLVGLLVALPAKLFQGDKSGPLPLNLGHLNFEAIIILLLWAGLNVALYLRWVMAVGSVSHTRLMFPAIAAISLLLALGWQAILPQRWAGWFSGGIIAAFVTLNIYSLGWLIYPAFRPEGGVEEWKSGRVEEWENGGVEDGGGGRLGTNSPFANSLNLTFLNSLKLSRGQVYPQHLGPARAKQESQVGPGEVVMAAVDWHVLRTMDKNYSLAAALLAPDGSVLAQRETYPGLGLRPTRYLQAGQRFRDAYPLRLEQSVEEPLVARVTVTLFDLDSATRAGFPALDDQGNPVTPIVGQIKIVPHPWPVYQPDHPLDVRFDQTIALIGYELTTGDSVQTGPGPIVTLYWESLAPVEQDYVVFLHLVDAAGQVIAQADAPPTNNAYPTSWWAPGEIIADRRPLPDPSQAATLHLGLYDLASGQRLPIAESSLPQQNNTVEIGLPK